MKTARSLFQRWRSLFRKEQLDRDLSDELAAHLEMHIADNLRAGLSPEVSRRNALLRLGGVEQTKESYRERRGLPLLETLWQDLRFVQTMEQRIAASLGPRRSAIDLLSFFAMLGVTLSAIGLFALVRYSVVQRTQEIGVRIALGASATDVRRMVLRQGFRLVVTGLAAGCVASFVLARVFKTELYEVSASDPLTYIAVAAGLVLTALLASWLPARRASRVDPMVALRYE